MDPPTLATDFMRGIAKEGRKKSATEHQQQKSKDRSSSNGKQSDVKNCMLGVGNRERLKKGCSFCKNCAKNVEHHCITKCPIKQGYEQGGYLVTNANNFRKRVREESRFTVMQQSDTRYKSIQNFNTIQSKVKGFIVYGVVLKVAPTTSVFELKDTALIVTPISKKDKSSGQLIDEMSKMLVPADDFLTYTDRVVTRDHQKSQVQSAYIFDQIDTHSYGNEYRSRNQLQLQQHNTVLVPHNNSFHSFAYSQHLQNTTTLPFNFSTTNLPFFTQNQLMSSMHSPSHTQTMLRNDQILPGNKTNQVNSICKKLSENDSNDNVTDL